MSAKSPTAPDADVAKTVGLDGHFKRNRRITQGIVVAVLLAGGAFGTQRYMQSQKLRSMPQYEKAKVAPKDIEVAITATGTIKGLNTVEVGAEVSGKLIKVNVDFNDHVKKGDVLAEIDAEQASAAKAEASARVREADAAVKQAEATLREAVRNVNRSVEQSKQGLVSTSELEAAASAQERAEANLDSAKANATLTRATLELAKSKLEKTTIFSPIDGIVLSRLVEQGQTVTAGFQTPLLFKLTQDLKRMRLHVLIDEADVGRAKQGQNATFTVDAYPGKSFPSRVESLRNEPQTANNVVTYEAVLAVDNSELLLRPGMTATATIVVGRFEQVLAVPNAALRFTPPEPEKDKDEGLRLRPAPTQPKVNSGKKRVWVLDNTQNNQPKAVDITVGVTDGVVTELTDKALSEGTEVLVDVVTPL